MSDKNNRKLLNTTKSSVITTICSDILNDSENNVKYLCGV